MKAGAAAGKNDQGMYAELQFINAKNSSHEIRNAER
jgi:hypothetical protein